MEIKTSSGRFAEADVQAVAVAVFKDEKADEGFLKDVDTATGGLVGSILESGELKGKEGETAYIHLAPGGRMKATRLLLVGVGERNDYKRAQVSQFAGAAVRALRARNVKTVGLVPRLEGGDAEDAAAAAVEGAVMGVFERDNCGTVRREGGTALVS